MEYDLIENDGVFTLKNQNTTIGFVRFNELGEVEYIFVNPLFRRRNFASKLLELVRKKTGKRIINSLLNLYCIKFSHSAKKKRKSIIYFAVSLLTDFVDFNIEIYSQSSFIENIVKKIDTIYKELKKNEKSPETDYLFTNVKKDNFDKSISKIEMMNNLEDFDKE